MRPSWLVPIALLAVACTTQNLNAGGGEPGPDMATGGGGGGGNDGGGGGGGGSPMTFAVFGDCRPPNQNDTAGYPSTIISGIFSLAQTKGAQFAVGTGDYMFASTQSAVDAQVALLLEAQGKFTAGPIYHTLGNHECDGYTAGNCPNANETPNIQAFMSKLVPAGVTRPYYRIDVNTPNGKAKFLFIAANAWSSDQASWLKAQLADPTTYTFAVRHEPANDTQTPGVSPSEALLHSNPLTLEFLGHSHEYRRVDTQHVISGNGGAPMTSWNGSSYGFLLVQQLADGNISVTEIDEATGMQTDTWKVTPGGQNAP